MSEQTNEHDLIEMTAGADTLAWDIFRADNSRLPEELLRADFPANAEYALNIAKHLREAGYRKPRTVTTVEELDALPVKSAVLSAMGNFYVKDFDLDNPSDTWWSAAGSGAEFLTERVSLPAIVLHESPSTPTQGITCAGCEYQTNDVREGMAHAADTNHELTRAADEEGTTLTISVVHDEDLVYDDEEDEW